MLRKKLPAIHEDIKFLQQQGIHCRAAKPIQVPSIESKGFALGMAYVIEGSTLGGRVIMKHLSPRLQITETHGGTFFAGYGNETGSMWKEFIEALTEYANKPDQGSQVIEGAIAGFDMISTHFVKNSEQNEN